MPTPRYIEYLKSAIKNLNEALELAKMERFDSAFNYANQGSVDADNALDVIEFEQRKLHGE